MSMKTKRDLVVATVPDQGMKTEEFSSAQAAASRVFGRDKDASIIFEGNEAYVRSDGAIVYPSLADGGQMSKEEVLVARGFADHETSHKRYTHVATTMALNKHCEKTDNALLKSVVNGVDDLRVDYLAIRDYSGAKTNLEATTEAVLQEYLEYAKESPEDAASMDVALPLLITAEGRRRMGYRCPSLEKALDIPSKEDMENVRKYVDLAIQARNPNPLEGTKEVVAIGKAIIKAKEEKEEKEKPEKEKGKGGGKGEGEGEGKGEGEKGEGEGKGEKGEGEGKGKPTPEHKDDGSDVKGGAGGPPDVEDFTKQAMEKVFSQHTQSSKDTYRIFSTELDAYSRYGDETRMGQWMKEFDGVHDYEDEMHKMHGKISTMSRKLERALLSMQRRDWRTNTEFGGLDPKRLVQARMGKENVFRLREDRKEIDTAVSVMIDLSGSMWGYPAKLANQVAIALSIVMEKVGVAYEIMGWSNYFLRTRNPFSPGYGDREFWGKDWLQRANKMKDKRSGEFSRYEPLQMFEFKGFGERLVQARAGMGVIKHCAGGHNADSEAVKVSASHLRGRGESRKILFVLSDGMPAVSCDYSRSHLGQHLRNEIENLGKAGVDCVGIGIASDAVSHFYPNFVVVNDLEDLPKGAFDQMSRLLVGDRFKVDNSELMAVTNAK